MCVKDPGVTRRCRFGKPILKFEKLSSRCKQSSFKASYFRIQFMILQITERDGFLLLEMNQNLPFRDARSNGITLKNTLCPGGEDLRRLWMILGFALTHGLWLQKSDLAVKEGIHPHH